MAMQPPFATYFTFYRDFTGRPFLDIWLTPIEMLRRKADLADDPQNTSICTGVLHHTPPIPPHPDLAHVFVTDHRPEE